MHPTPEPHSGNNDAGVVALVPQATAARNSHCTLEISLTGSDQEQDRLACPTEEGGPHSLNPEDRDQPTTGFQRVCVLLAEGVLAQKVAESRLHQFPKVTTRSTLKKRSHDETPTGDTLIVEEVARCGSASPRHLGAVLQITRTPLQKALRRLEAAGSLVGVGATRNRVYRVGRRIATEAA